MALAWKHPSWEAWLNLLGYAIGSFRRRIGRNLALILGIASAVGWWGSVVLVSEGLRVLQDKALKEGPDLWVIQLQGGRPALIDLSWVNRLEGLLGVRRVRARVWGYLVVPALEANLVVWGEEEMSPEEADVGPGLARHLGLRPGDRLALDSAFSRAVFKVRHILSPQTSLWAHDAVIVSLEQARRLLGIPEGMASDLAIEVFPPEEIPALAREIASQVPGGRVTSREDMAHLYALTLSGRVGVLGALFGPVIIALFLLAWERLSGLSLEERAEIGVLKAIGWPTAIVLQVRLLESAIVAIGGTALGWLMAYVHVVVWKGAGVAPFLLGWSRLRPELWVSAPIDVAPIFGWSAVWILVFVGLSLWPAWRVSMMDPNEIRKIV